MSKRIYTVLLKGKTVHMDEAEYKAYVTEKDAASSAVKNKKDLNKVFPPSKDKPFEKPEKPEGRPATQGTEDADAARPQGVEPKKPLAQKPFTAQKPIEKPKQEPVRTKQPIPTYAQANTQQDLDRQRQMFHELVSINSTIDRIQGMVQGQGILTPEQVQSMIIPLKQQVAGLMESLVSRNDHMQQPTQQWEAPQQQEPEVEETEEAQPFAGEETPEEETAEHEQVESEEIEEDEQRRKPKPQLGPRRQVGTAERELESPSTNWTDSRD